jgi:outer membrane protein assembly complex protein YaeT
VFRKRPLLFASISLLLGLSFGLSIIFLEKFIAKKLLAVLATEIRASGPYDFSYESADLNLFRLKAIAKNAKIVSIRQPNKTLINVPRLEANFSIRRIQQRIADLLELKLIGAQLNGIGPDSAIFNVVDYLAVPVTPELDTPDRFIIKLHKLSLKQGQARETLANTNLSIKDLEIKLERDHKDNFDINVGIKKISLSKDKETKISQLREITSRIYITDDYIEIAQLQASLKQGKYNSSFVIDTKNNDELSGSAELDLKSDSMGLEKFFSADLNLSSTILGTLAQPSIEAELSSPQLNLFPRQLDSQLKTDNLISNLSANFLDQSFKIFINSINSSPDSALQISAKSPLLYKDGELRGSLNFSMKKLTLAGQDLSDINVSLNMAWPNTIKLNFNFNPSPSLLAEKVSGSCEYLLSKLECTSSSTLQSLKARATMSFKEGSSAFIEKAIIEIKHPDNFNLSAEIYGPAQLQLLKGSGQFEFADILRTDLNLEKSELFANSRADSKIQLNLKSLLWDNFKTTLNIKADNLSFLGLEDTNTKPSCLDGSFESRLYFENLDYKNISGYIDLPRLSLGCDPFALKLSKPIKLIAQRSTVPLPLIELKSSDGNLALSGDISISKGLNIKIKGASSLAAFLPFMSNLDELSGHLNLDASVIGQLYKPEIIGSLSVKEGIIAMANPALQASHVSGLVQLHGKTINFQEFSADLNGGELLIQGSLSLGSSDLSGLKAVFNNVALEPIPDSLLIMSGEVFLDTATEPTLKGNIKIDTFELIKRINVLNAIKDLPAELFATPQKSLRLASNTNQSGLKLDLNILADSSILVDTNFGQVESMAKLNISGDSASPQIQGEIQVLQGWFGLKDRRFDISSGKIIFIQNEKDPYLEILAESSVLTRQGENVVVFASIVGPISAVKLNLDSDRGFTEKEIINLLTSSSDISNSSESVSILPQSSNLDLPFVSDDSFFGFGRWLKRLTKIDSVSVEPSYNAKDGLVEPILVAEKRISPTLNLRGETSFGGSNYKAGGRLNYSLNPRTTISGIVESLSTQDVTTLGLDASYSFKPLKSNQLETNISGNLFLSTDSILQAIKLNEDSRVTTESISKIESTLVDFYFDNGFPDAEFTLKCEKMSDRALCEILSIKISEKDKQEFIGVRIEGDALPPSLMNWFDGMTSLSGTATKEQRESLASELTLRLRNEGFIRARVDSSYSFLEQETFLLLKIQIGHPISFVFEGNKTYSDADLLNTINIFSRKQPFGNNTINLLVQNITQLYQQNGFLEASVSWTSSIDQTDLRQTYLVKISEGSLAKLRSVKFSVSPGLSEKELSAYLNKFDELIAQQILEPSLLLPEFLNENCLNIKRALQNEGYIDSSVDYSLKLSAHSEQADLLYNIELADRRLFKSLEIRGLPQDFDFVQPEITLSEKKLLEFQGSLRNDLIEAGYYKANVSLKLENVIAVIEVLAEQPARIADINISGLETILPENIISKITLSKGDRFDQSEASEIRRRLMRTGLFSKVEISPADGSVDSSEEIMQIVFEERSMQSILVGAGVNSEYGLHLFGALTDREIFSDGRSLSARIDSYMDQLNGSISQGVIGLNYTDPEFIQNDIGAVSDLRFQRLDLSSQEFDLDRTSHAFYIHKNLDSHTSASLGHTIKLDNLDDVTAGAILDPEYDSGEVRLASINSNLLWDYRDNPLDPRKGQAFALSPQLALEAIGSEADFGILEFKYSKLFDFGKKLEKFNLAYTARAAAGWAFGDLEYIPITERFYSGGRNSVRGFRENSLGPKASDGAVIGADQLLAQSFELRYFVIEDASINIFVDSAKLALRDYTAEGEDFRFSAGIGSRYLSPIGPIGFDIGFPLDEKDGEPSVRLHFNIGTSF